MRQNLTQVAVKVWNFIAKYFNSVIAGIILFALFPLCYLAGYGIGLLYLAYFTQTAVSLVLFNIALVLAGGSIGWGGVHLAFEVGDQQWFPEIAEEPSPIPLSVALG